MFVQNILVKTCLLIVLLKITHSYVLFAANLDDFRSIAKKLIPDRLADQLTDMASRNSIKYRQQVASNAKQVNLNVKDTKDDVGQVKFNTEDVIDGSSEIEERVTTPRVIEQYITTQKKRFAIKNQLETIDFEELVEKVRAKLRNEPKKVEREKYNKDKKHGSVYTQKYNKTEAKTEASEYDDYKNTAIVENDGMIFKEAFLTKTNDSYEDYVMPDKDNKYESDGATPIRPKLKRFDSKIPLKKTNPTVKGRQIDAERISQYREKVLKAVALVENDESKEVFESLEEVKAKTETLFEEKGRPYKLKGTMIPTKEIYKMSSPNYFAKIPVVAERYDFNEPLPEKDREPENLKYFGNPPARVNKKVELNFNKERLS